jgi:phage shock protein E
MKSLKVLFAAFLVMLCVNASAQKAAYRNADAAQFKKMMETNPGVVLDVRTPDETSKGVIEGAVEIDFLGNDFEKKIAKLDKKKMYYVYCQGGGRSADAAEIMIKQGFTAVVNLDKGFGSWVKNGFPVSKK